MKARSALLLFGSMLAVAGCLSDDKKLATVRTDPFGKSPRTQAASFKPPPEATKEVSLRVDRVGRQLVAANSRISQKIAFLTLGVTHEEMFHQTQKDVSTIYITEGLAKQCKTDGELAAVLSQELGKLMSEQMVQARPARKSVPAYLLASPHVGNEASGSIGVADRTDDMIAAHFEKEWQDTRKNLPASPTPPDKLARSYLTSAGFDPKALETVASLLRKAEKQSTVEQSMTGKQGS